MPPINRRQLLLAGTAGVAAASLGASTSRATGGATSTGPILPTVFRSPRVEPFRDRLPLLPTVSGPDVSLVARTTQHRFHRDYDPSPSLAYQAVAGPGARSTYLGPTVEAREGEALRLRMRHAMTAHPFARDVDTTLHGAAPDHGTNPRTSVHLHGGVTPARYDGHPEDFLVRGERLTNVYPNRHEATSLWYHDHSLGTTRLNVYAGLAAVYQLRDRFDTGRRDNPLGLPAGEFEVPLVMQEKLFADGGRQSVRSTPLVPEGSWEGGAVGDRGVVNGKVWPEMPVARGLYRFRVLNAGSYSVWHLHFSNRMRFWVIGNEGGLLDAPVPVRGFRIGPAERYDLLVDFSDLAPGESVELRNDEAPPLQAAIIGAVTMPLFCRFRAGAARGFRGRVPTRLRGGRGRPRRLPAVRRPTRVRTLTVNQRSDEVRIPPAVMTLNNLGYTDDDLELPRQGTREVWQLVNTTGDPHNVHVHLAPFRILDRQPLNTLAYQLANPMPALGTRWTPSPDRFLSGAAVRPPAWEAGPKDTIRCDPQSVNRIVFEWPTADELGFDPDAAFLPQGATARRVLRTCEGGHDHHGSHGTHTAAAPDPDRRLRGYMWHCHMLDHEDHDMMLRFRTPGGPRR